MNIRNFKRMFMMFIIVLLVGCSKVSSIDFNKDIELMGYKNIVEVVYEKDNSMTLKKEDDSEFTQEEMDNIFIYINSNYIKNEKYDTNIIYKTNYKEINIEIKER